MKAGYERRYKNFKIKNIGQYCGGFDAVYLHYIWHLFRLFRFLYAQQI